MKNVNEWFEYPAIPRVNMHVQHLSKRKSKTHVRMTKKY